MVSRIRAGGLSVLAIASLAFLAANLVHTADHLRQGTGRLSIEILVAGTGLTLAALATVPFAVRRDPRAPLFAAIVGLPGAVGIAAAHIAPHWSALSDPYPGNGLDALSWAVVLLEIGAAAVLGLVGVRELRRAERLPGRAAASTS